MNRGCASRCLAIALALLVLVLPAAARAFSIEDERKLGKEFYERMEKSGVLVKDPAVTRYVHALGMKVLAKFPPTPFAFRFSVINSSAINAFATPGGYVYVNRGLITTVESESQLASVLSHEIAHVQARHIAQLIERSKKINIATLAAILAGAFLGGGGDLGAAAMSFSLAGAATMSLKYSREHEEEADRLGLMALMASGYDGNAAVEFLRLMRRYEFYSNMVPSYFLTHPGTEQRIAYLDTMLAMKHPSPPTTTYVGNLKRVQTILLLAGEEPQANLKRFQENSQKTPDDVDDLYGLAVTQEKLGLTAEAQATFRRALAKAPDDPILLRDLGISYFRAGRLESAIPCLARAYQLASEDETTALYLGRAYQAVGNYAAALEPLRRALKANSEDAELRYALAMTYGGMGEAAESHYHFGMYFKQKHNRSMALYHLEEALKALPAGSGRASEVAKEIEALKAPPHSLSEPQTPAGRTHAKALS